MVGGIISTPKQISPPRDLQIHVQISKSGGSGDGRDIFGMFI